MASVTVNRATFVPGNDYRVIATWTGDSSYASGGEGLSLAELGFGTEAVFSHANTLYVENLSEQAVFIPSTAKFDGTKVHLFDAATGKEIASTKDVSKVKVGLEVVCTTN